MTHTWPAKDPDAVDYYGYTIALDTGDSLVDYDVEKLSGDVTLSSFSRSGADVTVWLSGGTDGETGVFRISWVTANGITDDDVVVIAIAAHEPEELLFTGYMKPSVAHLLARYPAFADVSPITIKLWLADAERVVTETWIEGDYAPGLMSLAAHNMAMLGLGSTSSSASSPVTALPAGVTSVKSADFAMSITPEQANRASSGSLESTLYGNEFYKLLRRNRAGPRVMATGTIPCSDVVYPTGAW